MKESKLKKGAVLLVVAALATTLGINGIYAKYSSENEKEAQARVAKWGVTIEAQDATGFSNTYAKGDASYTIGTNSVSTTSDGLVAPGTSGTFNGLKISGTPEVAVKITNTGDLTLTGWEVNETYYCPLKITVGAETLSGTSFDSAAKFEKAVEDKIAALTASFAPGTDLSKASIPEVSWAWDFSGDDAKDTALGNLATMPQVTLKLKSTVTQID